MRQNATTRVPLKRNNEIVSDRDGALRDVSSSGDAFPMKRYRFAFYVVWDRSEPSITQLLGSKLSRYLTCLQMTTSGRGSTRMEPRIDRPKKRARKILELRGPHDYGAILRYSENAWQSWENDFVLQ